MPLGSGRICIVLRWHCAILISQRFSPSRLYLQRDSVGRIMTFPSLWRTKRREWQEKMMENRLAAGLYREMLLICSNGCLLTSARNLCLLTSPLNQFRGQKFRNVPCSTHFLFLYLIKEPAVCWLCAALVSGVRWRPGWDEDLACLRLSAWDS